MNRVEIFDARSPEVEAIWRGLEERSAPSYFQTWAFVENWLACLPPRVRPELVLMRDDSGVVLGFFCGKRLELRHGLIPSRERFLNATGVERFDEICAEHNAVLVAPGARVGLELLVALLPDDWDELVLPALAAGDFPGRALGDPLAGYQLRVERRVASPFVDLARVRAARDGYLELLAPSTRAQIRRAERGLGPLELELAGSEAEAFDIYDELVRLHTASWHERGERGAFADPWFERLHRRLIGHRFVHGEVQLLRVRARGATVGCLYNFVSRGRVLFYQSGLAHFDDPRIKPGYVCHAAAVRHDAEAGHASYDFLGGESRYKQSLATDHAELVWARIQRPLARFAFERKLRELVRARRSARTPHRAAGA